jgi:hypothetical protein
MFAKGHLHHPVGTEFETGFVDTACATFLHVILMLFMFMLCPSGPSLLFPV